MPLPRTTVICAVWHQGPLRFELLKGHQSCIARQTIAVESVYVFDGGDTPPPDLKGKVVISREALTIYQAWNLALVTVGTPFVINLNLDDRLACDAIQIFESEMDKGADLVGGDWLNCFSQGETDAVGASRSIEGIAVQRANPPPKDVPTRLGCLLGDGRKYIGLGHAAMWRMALHREIPRYPMEARDGTLLRVIGDSIWWRLWANRGKRLVYVPRIIGHYHSHPENQLEFRHSKRTEAACVKSHGLKEI
jgi:hypothetical protein